MRLAIIHYHLRKGGVTRVIASALEALGPEVDSAVVLSSTESEEPLPCPVGLIPGLAYDPDATVQKADALYAAIRKSAREHLGGEPDVWHIHNHNLGKNACFPEVLRRLINEGARVLLQIHDFAEDGRPGNFKIRQSPYVSGIFEEADKALYPVAPQIGYAVLNGRDQAILRNAGIPAENLFWLPNAVTAPDLPGQPVPPAKPSGTQPLILYPTRAIRRKNVGELLLLAATYPQFRFATTLSPKNPQWAAVHDGWIALGKELKLSVELALGEQPGNSFASLIHEARAMVTTSVGEGFGLAFLEPWLLGKPVIGRDLPEVTGDFKENGIKLPDLYEEWRIPSCLLDLESFRDRYWTCLNAMYKAYGRSPGKGSLQSAWTHLTREGKIDFGALDEIAQTQVIRSVCSGNRGMLQSPLKLDEFEPFDISTNARKIREVYGLNHYGKNLLGIYRQLGSVTPALTQPISAKAVLEAFLDPTRLRMLRS